MKNDQEKKPSVIAAAGCLLIFFLAGLIGILHHEMWLDELHHWMLARVSSSPFDLLVSMKLEGHPPLWNLLLFCLSRFTRDPFSMQLLHILLACAAMSLFLLRAPFSFLFKAGVMFSYFIFYEYHIISRSYVTGLLLTWLICILLTKKERNNLLLALLLGLLAMVHLFFLFLSFALFLIMKYDAVKHDEKKNGWPAAAVYLTLLSGSIYMIIPPENHFLMQTVQEPFFASTRIEKACSSFIKAFLHIPDFRISNCWNSNFLLREYRNFFLIPALLYLVIPFLILHKNIVALFVFYFTSLAISGFLYCFPLVAGVRYFGVIYVTFIVSLWIQKSSRYGIIFIYPDKIKNTLNSLQRLVTTPFMILLFGSQLISSCIMFVKDYTRPFSDVKEAATFIVSNEMAGSSLSVSNVACISAMAGYLDKKLYSPEAARYCSFSPWDVRPFQYDEKQLIDALKTNMLPDYDRITLVTNHALHFQSAKHPYSYEDDEMTLYPVRHFTKGIVSTEHYFIYSIVRKRSE